MTEAPQTGIRELDRLVDGLRVGDNVVWLAHRRLWTSLLKPFIETGRQGLCYVTVDSPAEDVLRRVSSQMTLGRFVLVDCHSYASARAMPRPVTDLHAADVRVADDPRDLGTVQVLMKELEDEMGRGTGYVFESLTGMQQLWGPDAALSFFLRHCPRLYDLDTVAYWLLDPAKHDQSFVQRIQQVTQVMLEVSEADDLVVRVVKADARSADVVGRAARLEEQSDGRLRVVVEPPSDRTAAGELLKRRRMELGISQTELARRLGITPSALSQAERGKRGLSTETMKLAWRELGVGEGGDAQRAPGYVLARRGARVPRLVTTGVEDEKVIEQASGFEVHLIAFAPGASGRRPPVATKRPEFVFVTEGVLKLRIGDATEVLHAGDAIAIGTQPLNGWRNPSPTVTRAMWMILP
jgi:transcriptional regulator with XRE-family HTH domain